MPFLKSHLRRKLLNSHKTASLEENFLACLTQFCVHFSSIQTKVDLDNTFICCSRHLLQTDQLVCFLTLILLTLIIISYAWFALHHLPLAKMEENIKRYASKMWKQESILDYFPITDRVIFMVHLYQRVLSNSRFLL